MIIEFIQNGRQPNPTFVGCCNDLQIAFGSGMTHRKDAFLSYENNTISIDSSIHKEKIDGHIATQVSDLICNGKRIGYIFPDLVAKKKILFLSFGYDFFNCSVNGNKYKFYEVGLGPEKHYVCVYNSSDQLISIIHKHDMVRNYKDSYTIYLLEKTYAEIAMLVALYFDCVRYPDHGEITGADRTDDSFLTVQKELNDKFDPLFIEKVKSLENRN